MNKHARTGREKKRRERGGQAQMETPTELDTIVGRAKQYWREHAFAELQQLCGGTAEITAEQLVVQYTQESRRGDLALPLFPFARHARSSPQQLAALLEGRLNSGDADRTRWGRAEAAGGYLNIHLNRGEVIRQLLSGDDVALPCPALPLPHR